MITVWCNAHNEEIKTTPVKFFRGAVGPCELCKSNNLSLIRLKPKEFITKSKEKYGDQFTYNNMGYIGYNNEINLICTIHNDEPIKITPKNHLRNIKGGCSICVTEYMKTKILNEIPIQFRAQFEQIDTKIDEKQIQKLKCLTCEEYIETTLSELRNQKEETKSQNLMVRALIV